MTLSEGGWVRRALSVYCAAWIALAVCELLLLYVVSDSAVHHPQIPGPARFTLAAHDLWALALVLLSAAPVLLLLSLLAHHRPRWATGVSIALVSAFAFLYGGSWGSFWSAGGFLNRDSIEFWVIQPIQVMHWVHPALLFGLPVVAVAAALVVCLAIPRILDRLSSRGEHRLQITVAAAIVVCFGLQWWGTEGVRDAKQLVSEPIVGVRYRLGQLYEEVRRDRSGAFAHALHLASANDDWWRQNGPNRDLAVERKPLVPLDEWAQGIDRESLAPLNVILVLVESLRADQLRIYGARREVMPAVDSLAEESQTFLRAYTQASHSNYADMGPLSGHYPLRSLRTHVYPKELPYPRVMIYDVLKALGWRTAIFSSQNENWGKMINYLDTGTLDRFLHAESWDGPTYVSETDTGFAAWVANTEHAGSIDDRYTVDEAIEWMESDPDRPFFFYMNLQNSHFPYVVPEGYPRPFGPDSIDFRMTFNHYPRKKIPVVKDLYADSLHYIDAQLARLFDALKERGLDENTVVILSGDTGQAFYEHGFASHGNALYDEVMRVPLLMRIPGMTARLRGEPAQHVDVPSTIAGLVGFPPHPAWQGIDLFQPAPLTRDIFLVAQTPIAHQYAIVRKGFKLIYDPKLDRSILYDLKTDAAEKHDVTKARPEIRQELWERLHTWRHLQVDYYSNPIAQKTWYPPVLGE